MLELRELFETSPDAEPGECFLRRAAAERRLGRENSAAEAAWHVLRLVDRLDEYGTPGASVSEWGLLHATRLLREVETDDPDSNHLRGILEATLSDPAHRDAVLRMALTAYAYHLEHEGRYAEARELLRLVVLRTAPAPAPAEAVPLSFFLARLDLTLARWAAASRAYRFAEELARQLYLPENEMLARLGMAGVLLGQGDLPGAEAMTRDVIDCARSLGAGEIEGRAMADLATVLARRGHLPDSLMTRYNCLELVRDPTQRARIFGELGDALRQVGSCDAARLAFGLALAGDSSARNITRVHVALMELESARKNRVGFERHRSELADLESRMSPENGVAFRYHSGVGFARFGAFSRARATLHEALRMAEAHHLNDWYFRVDRILAELDNCTSIRAEAAAADPDFPGDVTRITEGLRLLATTR